MGSGKKLRSREMLQGGGKEMTRMSGMGSDKYEAVRRIVLVWLEQHEEVQQKIGVDVRADSSARCCLLQNVFVYHQDIHGLQRDG